MMIVKNLTYDVCATTKTLTPYLSVVPKVEALPLLPIC